MISICYMGQEDKSYKNLRRITILDLSILVKSTLLFILDNIFSTLCLNSSVLLSLSNTEQRSPQNLSITFTKYVPNFNFKLLKITGLKSQTKSPKYKVNFFLLPNFMDLMISFSIWTLEKRRKWLVKISIITCRLQCSNSIFRKINQTIVILYRLLRRKDQSLDLSDQAATSLLQ